MWLIGVYHVPQIRQSVSVLDLAKLLILCAELHVDGLAILVSMHKCDSVLTLPTYERLTRFNSSHVQRVFRDSSLGKPLHHSLTQLAKIWNLWRFLFLLLFKRTLHCVPPNVALPVTVMAAPLRPLSVDGHAQALLVFVLCAGITA